MMGYHSLIIIEGGLYTKYFKELGKTPKERVLNYIILKTSGIENDID